MHNASLPLHIHGIGTVCAFGCGTQILHAALERGRRPPLREAHPASTLPPALLADVAPLERFAPKRALRRLDHFSRLALLGAHLALEDAGLSPADIAGAGLILATGYGAAATTFSFLDSCIDDGDALASPTHFSHSVHNAAAANTAINLGLRGPCCTVSLFGLSFASALATARAWMIEGRVTSILLGAVDEACDVLRYCHGRFAASGAHPCPHVPPSEGAAFFLLRATPSDRGAAFTEVEFSPRLPPPAGACIVNGCFRDVPAAHCVSYAPLFGCYPTSQGLDAAAAALALSQQRFPGLPEERAARVSLEQGIHLLGKDAALESRVTLRSFPPEKGITPFP